MRARTADRGHSGICLEFERREQHRLGSQWSQLCGCGRIGAHEAAVGDTVERVAVAAHLAAVRRCLQGGNAASAEALRGYG